MNPESLTHSFHYSLSSSPPLMSLLPPNSSDASHEAVCEEEDEDEEGVLYLSRGQQPAGHLAK
jgi:hypothetical protein